MSADPLLSEIILKDDQDERIHPLDITTEGLTCPYKDDGSYCIGCSNTALLWKLKEVPRSQRKKWIIYQMNLRKDKELFLQELEAALYDNVDFFDDRGALVDQYLLLIDEVNQEMNVAASDTVTISREEYEGLLKKIEESMYPAFYWRGDKTQLMELIVVLTEAGLITDAKGNSIRKHITAFFEQVLNYPMIEPEKTVSKIKAKTHLRIPQFMETLIKVFETWQKKEIEK
jgi:hypothetical protein